MPGRNEYGEVTSASNCITYAKTRVDPDTGYLVPEHFDYAWAGTDFAGAPFRASCSGTPTARMARIDLLENVPSVLRKVIEGLTTVRPYIYQHFDRNVQATVCHAGRELVLTGNLFQEFSFLLDDPAFSVRSPALSTASQ